MVPTRLQPGGTFRSRFAAADGAELKLVSRPRSPPSFLLRGYRRASPTGEFFLDAGATNLRDEHRPVVVYSVPLADSEIVGLAGDSWSCWPPSYPRPLSGLSRGIHFDNLHHAEFLMIHHVAVVDEAPGEIQKARAERHASLPRHHH
jgi:hypothetical protein